MKICYFQCKAGCGLYIVNGTLGGIVHGYARIAYKMFENCIKKGTTLYSLYIYEIRKIPFKLIAFAIRLKDTSIFRALKVISLSVA
jgi:hypothetical protein